jgi:hypothetical protein
MKNIPKKLDNGVSVFSVMIGRAYERTQRNGRSGGIEGGSAHDEREDAPLLVAIDEPRCDSADVRAGTDEQEDNEQKRLEIEKGGLRVYSGYPCQFETDRNGRE